MAGIAKLYVGNLPYSVTKEELQDTFSAHGTVNSVTVIEGKGFGFVEMGSPEEAAKAKSALDGNDFGGRKMKVDEARPKEGGSSRGGRGGYGDRGGNRGGFGGNRGGNRY